MSETQNPLELRRVQLNEQPVGVVEHGDVGGLQGFDHRGELCNVLLSHKRLKYESISVQKRQGRRARQRVRGQSDVETFNNCLWEVSAARQRRRRLNLDIVIGWIHSMN